MLLLLVVGSNLTDGVSQGQGLLPVVGRPQGHVLGIFVKGQLAIPEHTVQVVPGPVKTKTALLQHLCNQFLQLCLVFITSLLP